MEKEVATGFPAENAAPAAEPTIVPDPKPVAIYTGLNGEIKSVDELKNYAQTLETILVSNKKPPEAGARTFMTSMGQAGNLPNALGEAKGESFEDVFYSNPTKAKEILKAEMRAENDLAAATKRQQEAFWQSFYSKNTDLNGMDQVVQSIFKRDRQLIGDLKDDNEVREYLAKESRDMIGFVKKTAGVVETRLESAPAVSFASSGEPIPNIPGKPSGPISMMDQVALYKSKRRK